MRRTIVPSFPTRLLIAAAVLSIAMVASASADDYPRNPAIDIVHYRFHVTLSDATDEVRGIAAVTVRFVTDGVTEFDLDLDGGGNGTVSQARGGSNQGARSARGAGMLVAAVRRDGISLRTTHRDDRLTIELLSPSRAEEERTFEIDYAGVPADGLVISENKYGERTFFADHYPDRAHLWLPCVDHVYRNTVPVAPKVMAMGAARFAVQHVATVRGIPVQSWVYPQEREAGFHDFALAARILDYFHTQIGPYSYAKLANVQSKTRYGGMEYAGNIFYGERAIRGDRGNERLVAHEIAHQWFGDSVTEDDWHHLWLSEGFATYFTQLYMEHTYGRDRMVQGMQRARDSVFQYYESNPDLGVISPGVSDLGRMLNTNAYQKGGWFLHMLRRQVGDERFWNGIRAFYSRHRDGNAMTEDFQRVMEEVSGQDLGWFFEQWIWPPGHPVLRGVWSYDAGGRQLTVTLRQVQATGTVYRLSLDLAIYAGPDSAPLVETIELDGSEGSFTFDLERSPTSVVLDPGTWVLMDAELTRR
jgi:hypothetical protein